MKISADVLYTYNTLELGRLAGEPRAESREFGDEERVAFQAFAKVAGIQST